jgi:hypothetical protein
MCVCMHACIYVCIHTCMYVWHLCACVFMHVCMLCNVGIYACMHICMCACMYTSCLRQIVVVHHAKVRHRMIERQRIHIKSVDFCSCLQFEHTSPSNSPPLVGMNDLRHLTGCAWLLDTAERRTASAVTIRRTGAHRNIFCSALGLSSLRSCAGKKKWMCQGDSTAHLRCMLIRWLFMIPAKDCFFCALLGNQLGK